MMNFFSIRPPRLGGGGDAVVPLDKEEKEEEWEGIPTPISTLRAAAAAVGVVAATAAVVEVGRQ